MHLRAKGILLLACCALLGSLHAQTVILSETVERPKAPDTETTSEGKSEKGETFGADLFYGVGYAIGDATGPVTHEPFMNPNIVLGWNFRHHFAKRQAVVYDLSFGTHTYRLKWEDRPQYALPDSFQYLQQQINMGNFQLGARYRVNLTGNAWAGEQQGLFLEVGGRMLLRTDANLITRHYDAVSDDRLTIRRNLREYMNSPFQFAVVARLGYRFLSLEYEHRMTDYFKTGKLPLDVQMPAGTLRLVLLLGLDD